MNGMNRRDALKAMAVVTAAAATGCSPGETASAVPNQSPARPEQPDMTTNPILRTQALGFQWPTLDPFLFCVHHDDKYPKGNDKFGPAASLAGRNIGQDFEVKDGWRMYHGAVVPGFPQHPHRGFETVTVVRKGLLDHSDSLGAAARYGGGDVQWLTAGKGIIHAEMFPLLDADKDNPVELFQIWLNLPKADKFAEPHFTMLWNDTIPRKVFSDERGTTTVTLTAGRLEDTAPPAPPPSSYGSKADSDLAIWTIKMTPGARWILPAAKPGTNRALYFFEGRGLKVNGHSLTASTMAVVKPDVAIQLDAETETEILVLQGRPIAEPVVQYGPFVMNTREEIQQAFDDYRRTHFGGWTWSSDDPVHGREGRFARHADGTVEKPTS